MQILITLSPCLSAGNCGKSNTKRRKGQGTQTGLPRVWRNYGKNAESTKPKPSNYRTTMKSRTRKSKSKTRRGRSPTNEGKPKEAGRKESRMKSRTRTSKSKSKTRRGGSPTNEAKSESWLYTLRNTTYCNLLHEALSNSCIFGKEPKYYYFIEIDLNRIPPNSQTCITHMIWSHNASKNLFSSPSSPPPT